jgi:hypothetical protein
LQEIGAVLDIQLMTIFDGYTHEYSLHVFTVIQHRPARRFNRYPQGDSTLHNHYRNP